MNTETEITNLIDIKTLDWADVRVLSLVNSLNIDHKAVVRPLMDRIAKLENALRKIAAIQNCYDGGDWDEIENARLIANEVLASSKPPHHTFTTHGRVWIRHNPGDPMPCGGEERVRVLLQDGTHDEEESCTASGWSWANYEHLGDSVVIGWNYADSSKEVRA